MSIKKLFFILLFLAILNGYFYQFINDTFVHYENTSFHEISIGEEFFLVVLFAPIVETIILQFCLYQLLALTKVKSFHFYLIVMGFVFSQIHWYHWLYVLMTFSSGLLINYLYLKVLFKTKNQTKAVFLTILFHASYNLFGFLKSALDF